MKKLGALSAVIVLAGSLSALAAGCGSTPSGNSSNQTAQSNTPVDGGTLTIGQGTKFNDQFIPDMDASLYTYNIDQYAFDSLMTVDNQNNFVPDLAKSWTWSADKKTVTIDLDPNANWSDGQPITSDDVLFTIDYLASPEYTNDVQGQYSYLVQNIKGYDEIQKGKAKSFADTGGFTKVSDKEFKLTFTTVDAAVLWSCISGIQPIPKHVLQNTPIKDWPTLQENKLPTVVSGPFKFVSVSGSDSVTMEANPNYFRGKPHIQKLIFKTVSPDVAPGMLQNGQIDLMMNGLKPQDVDNIKKISGVNVYTAPENGFNYLGLKLYVPEFKDVRVRQAFEYALDRKTMIQGILKGYGVPINGPLPQVSWAAATPADGMNQYDYDPNKANQLLDEAGWTKGSDGYRIDPVTHKEANIHLSYSSGNPAVQSEAVAIQQYLGKVGVKVTLDPPMDFNTLAKDVETDAKNIQMWLMGWSLSVDPDPRGLWGSKDAMNFPRWQDPHNDQLIAATYNAAAFDKNVRKQALVQWQLYVNQQLPYVFLWSPDVVVAYNKRVHIPQQDWGVGGALLNAQEWWVQ